MPLRHHPHRADHTAPRSVAPGPAAVSTRDPAHVLYDQACDLLAAAQGLRDAGSGAPVSPAVPATLGCLAASLDALADAVEHLGEQAVDRVGSAGRFAHGNGNGPIPDAGAADDDGAAGGGAEQLTAGLAARQFSELSRTLRTGRDTAARALARSRASAC